jgi:hypothetical protein
MPHLSALKWEATIEPNMHRAVWATPCASNSNKYATIIHYTNGRYDFILRESPLANVVKAWRGISETKVQTLVNEHCEEDALVAYCLELERQKSLWSKLKG